MNHNLLRQLARVAAVMLMLGLGGCAGLSDLKKPDVQVVSIEPGKATLFNQDFSMVLRVQNPNNRELKAQGVYFELSSNGQQLATGVSNKPIVLPPLGETTIPLTIHASLGDLIRLAGAAFSSGNPSIGYHISGYLDGFGSWGRIPFSRDYQLKLPN